MSSEMKMDTGNQQGQEDHVIYNMRSGFVKYSANQCAESIL